jgi:hypothetical protein
MSGARVGPAVDAAADSAGEVKQLECGEADLLVLAADADDGRAAAAAGGRPAQEDLVGVHALQPTTSRPIRKDRGTLDR